VQECTLQPPAYDMITFIDGQGISTNANLKTNGHDSIRISMACSPVEAI
jgi:hypothetical protein